MLTMAAGTLRLWVDQTRADRTEGKTGLTTGPLACSAPTGA